jgi:ureidoacrylate peracid hydrolase
MTPYITKENLSEKCAEWLHAIREVNNHLFEPDLSHMALLVIDMQVFFCIPGAPACLEAADAILPNVKKLINQFRQWNRPIIYTRHVHRSDGSDAGIMKWWWQDMCIEGTPESEIHPNLTPLPNELIVTKHRYSAFYNTDLEVLLRGKSITDLVITGVMTNLCCETTTRDAYMRDYKVQFVADATATATEEMHLAALLNLALGFANVTTTSHVLASLTDQQVSKKKIGHISLL